MHPQERKRMAKVKLEFKKDYNYKMCYQIGKFRLYVYDNEHHQKIDMITSTNQIMCGHIPACKELLTNFAKNIPAQLLTQEMKCEIARIHANLTDGFAKVADSPDWFRITFNELKYIPGNK